MDKCRGQRSSFAVKPSKETTDHLREFSRKSDVLSAVILSISVGMLLHRYSGEAHVTVNIKTRVDESHAEIDFDLNESLTVRNLMHQTYEQMKLLNLLKTGSEAADDESKVEFAFPVHLARPLMRVVNPLEVRDCNDELTVACECNAPNFCCTFLYEGELIARMAENFQSLLRETLINIDSKCSDLPMLSSEEIGKLTYVGNETELENENKCFQELFYEQVTRNPNRKVLFCKNETLTYAELNSRANKAAHCLQQMGAGPDVVIALGMERSLDAIVGIVAILKTGAAYCAIDPDYPTIRIDEILREAGATVILTTSTHSAHFSACGIKSLKIDDLPENGKIHFDNILCSVHLENAAYITFTSGSTGKPKGVIATHRSISTLSALGRYFYRGESSEVFCLNASLVFSSAATLLMALCCGFPLVVIPHGQEKDPRAIALAVQQYGITNLSIMPSVLRQILTLGAEGKTMLRSIKRVALSGSEVTWDLVEPFRKMMPNGKLTTGYASSEICAVAFGNYVDLEKKEKSGRVPLGKPNPSAQVLILDQYLNLAPIGAPGELYIASPHMARGYIGNPAATAERFLPNPFGRSPGDRMYRTGDFVRYRPDGEIEFLGRFDNQVKIRGYRVELEEIEAVLTNHPEIEEAAVIGDKNERSERLAAFIVKKGNSETNITRLRQYLKQQLPSYMVPSMYVILDHLPMTANGKVDRHALTLTSAKPIMPNQGYEAPRDLIEEKLVQIWQKSIGLDTVGICDEFLDLGGESLTATMIIMEIRERFGVEIPLPMFFGGLTVEILAAEISQIQERETVQSFIR
jgi:amino acid adenylation domain-containing protein